MHSEQSPSCTPSAHAQVGASASAGCKIQGAVRLTPGFWRRVSFKPHRLALYSHLFSPPLEFPFQEFHHLFQEFIYPFRPKYPAQNINGPLTTFPRQAAPKQSVPERSGVHLYIKVCKYIIKTRMAASLHNPTQRPPQVWRSRGPCCCKGFLKNACVIADFSTPRALCRHRCQLTRVAPRALSSCKTFSCTDRTTVSPVNYRDTYLRKIAVPTRWNKRHRRMFICERCGVCRHTGRQHSDR